MEMRRRELMTLVGGVVAAARLELIGEEFAHSRQTPPAGFQESSRAYHLEPS
jgi:hypothetical protein